MKHFFISGYALFIFTFFASCKKNNSPVINSQTVSCTITKETSSAQSAAIYTYEFDEKGYLSTLNQVNNGIKRISNPTDYCFRLRRQTESLCKYEVLEIHRFAP